MQPKPFALDAHTALTFLQMGPGRFILQQPFWGTPGGTPTWGFSCSGEAINLTHFGTLARRDSRLRWQAPPPAMRPRRSSVLRFLSDGMRSVLGVGVLVLQALSALTVGTVERSLTAECLEKFDWGNYRRASEGLDDSFTQEVVRLYRFLWSATLCLWAPARA